MSDFDEFYIPRVGEFEYNLVRPEIRCLKDPNLKIESQHPYSTFTRLDFMFLPCNEISDGCISEADREAWFTELYAYYNIYPTLNVNFSYKQIDMSDLDDPVKTFRSVQRFDFSRTPQGDTVEFKLAKNEFKDDKRRFGFIRKEIEPIEFLTVDSTARTWEQELTYSHVTVSLSDNKYFSERKAYSLFTLLGDVGGFNGAIIILPVFLMSRYNESMYTAAIKQEIPIRKSQKKKQESE